MFDRGDPTHLATLHTELITDPQQLGYGPLLTAGALSEVAAKLMEIYPASINVQLGDVPTHKVRSCISLGDWVTITAEERSYLHFLLDSEIVNLSDGMVDNNLVQTGGIWAPGAANVPGSALNRGLNSRARLMAMKQRKATRAEELFGIDTAIYWPDVQAAKDFTP